MPDAQGNFKPISVPAAAWERVFGKRCACSGTLMAAGSRAKYCSPQCRAKAHHLNRDKNDKER